jgi:hypothetical protein
MLFRSSGGGLTAVKRTDAEPVVVPPPPKKAAKKSPASSVSGGTTSACAAASAAKSAAALARKSTAAAVRAAKAQEAAAAVADAKGTPSVTLDVPSKSDDRSAPVIGGVRKISSDPSIASMVAKRMRSRARRMTAGQAPGRYHSVSRPASVDDTDTDYMHFLPSPSSGSSLRSLPTSPSPFDDGFSLRASSHHVAVDPHSESPYQFKDPAGDDAFPDVACLGIGGGSDSEETPASLSLPAMAADPSSAEHFSFSDSISVFGAPDPALVVDPLYQRTALLSLIRDRSLPAGRLFHTCVRALAELGLRLLESRYPLPSAVSKFVRAFAAEHSSSSPNEDEHMASIGEDGDEEDEDDEAESVARGSHCSMAARLLFPERVVYDHAVDAFRAMCDCANLAIFSLPLLLLVLEEDVALLMASPNVPVTEIEIGSCTLRCAVGHSVSAHA